MAAALAGPLKGAEGPGEGGWRGAGTDRGVGGVELCGATAGAKAEETDRANRALWFCAACQPVPTLPGPPSSPRLAPRATRSCASPSPSPTACWRRCLRTRHTSCSLAGRLTRWWVGVLRCTMPCCLLGAGPGQAVNANGRCWLSPMAELCCTSMCGLPPTPLLPPTPFPPHPQATDPNAPSVERDDFAIELAMLDE